MKKVKFCKDCKWGSPEIGFEWNTRCNHPLVNAGNPWALASQKLNYGVNCQEERGKRWFAKCGMAGKLWEVTND